MLAQTYGSQNMFYGSQGYAEWMLVIMVNDAEPLNTGPVRSVLALRLCSYKALSSCCRIEEVSLEKLVVSLSRHVQNHFLFFPLSTQDKSSVPEKVNIWCFNLPFLHHIPAILWDQIKPIWEIWSTQDKGISSLTVSYLTSSTVCLARSVSSSVMSVYPI